MTPILIHEDRVEELHAALAVLAKRARRHKLDQPLYTVGALACLEWHTYKDWDG